MSNRLEDDPVFKAMVLEVNFPSLDAISALAKARNITEVPYFWELFDSIKHARSQKRSTEEDWNLP